MTSAGFLKQLRKLLQEGDWQPVLSALRLDPLVWDTLQDEEFCQRALESCASDPEEWNPARLGLLKLGASLDFRSLRKKPVSQLDPDLAAQLLTLSTAPLEPSGDLGTALLTALLALEKYYQSGQWQRALADIFDQQAILAPSVLACLIPIVPDPVVLLSSFLSGNLFPKPAERRSLLTHAILANPLNAEQQIDLLVRVLTTVPEVEQLDTLAWLKQNNLARLASLTAERLLGKGKSQNRIADKDEPQPEEKLADFDTVYTQAMLQKLSGKLDESKLTLTRGLDLLKTRQEKLLDALELIDKPAAPAVPAAQAGTTPSAGNTDNEQPIVDAQQMVNNISLQIQAGEYEKADSLLSRAQQLFPSDPEISRLRAELSRHNGRSTEAIDALQTAVMLKPDDMSLRKTLAATYEERGAWQDALDERMSYLKYFPTPPEQELLSVAATAIRANQLGVAETACHTILELQPENGQANAIYGELLHAKGEDEKALLHLTRATTLSPDLPAPWLVISRIYRDQGNDTFSNDTLKAAAQVLPDSPEIQFALGENCLANSSPSEALVYLRKAYKYDPSSPAISLRLGENLTALGLFDEADRILADARQTRATDPELALVHSKALLGLGEADQALDTITIALEAEPQNTSILSTLSEIFESAINEYKNLAQVLAAHPKLNGLIGHVLSFLETAISAHPASLDLQMLAADLLAETGSPEQAISLYQNLLQKLPYKHEAQWRAQFGLGRIALRLGQLDTALVALKEASQLVPDRSDILKSLAETYRAANLPREALETSHAVVELGTGDADGYLWQADLCLKLGDAAEAATAIEKALALDPGRPELVLKHAQALQASGSPEPALARLDELSARQDLDPGNLKAAADLYSQLGNRAKSRACLQKAVGKSENPDAGLLANLADAYAGEDQPEEALQTLDQALAVDPDNEELVIQRCKLLEKLGRSADAREYLLTILESPRAAAWSNEPISRMHARLAELLREGGDPDGALKFATQALALDPDNQSIRHLLLQLQRAWLLLSEETLQALVQQVLQQPVIDLDYPLTLAEAALDCNLIDEAMRLSDLFSDAADPLRLASVKARLDALAGETLDAFEHFQAAQVIPDEAVGFSLKLARLTGLAQTALALKQWNTACERSRSAMELAPDEPLAVLLTLKAIIFEAEENELCDRLKIRQHRPERSGASVEDYQELLAVLPQAKDNALIRYWKARSDSMFGLEADKKALLSPPALLANELAGSLFALIAARQLKEADRLLEANPQNAEMIKLHAAALLESDPETSAADATRLLEIDPADPVALALKAYASQDDPFAAFEAIEKALDTWNNEPDWHALAASLSQALGNPQGRINHTLELIKLFPDSSEQQISAGSAYLDSGQADGAIHCLKRATLLDPADKTAWMLLGQSYHQAGNNDEALSALVKAIAIDPDDIEPLLLSGRIALASDAFDVAQASARQVMVLNPEEPRGLLLLTGILAKQGKQQEALKAIEAAAPALRKTLPVQVEQLMLTQALKGPKAILDQLETLGARNREDPQVLKALAECYSAIGHNDEAEQAAMDALKLVANDGGLHYLAGKLQRAKGQLDQSIDHLAEAIRLEPANIEAYLELALAYEDHRQYDQAVRIYQQAIIVAPNDYRSYYQAGLLLKDGKDFAPAEVMFKHAADLAPGDLNIRSQLGALMALNFVHHTQEALTRS